MAARPMVEVHVADLTGWIKAMKQLPQQNVNTAANGAILIASNIMMRAIKRSALSIDHRDSGFNTAVTRRRSRGGAGVARFARGGYKPLGTTISKKWLRNRKTSAKGTKGTRRVLIGPEAHTAMHASLVEFGTVHRRSDGGVTRTPARPFMRSGAMKSWPAVQNRFKEKMKVNLEKELLKLARQYAYPTRRKPRLGRGLKNNVFTT